MSIGGAKASRGECFIASFALKASYFLVVVFDSEEAFFNEGAIAFCVVEAIGVGAVFGGVGHSAFDECKNCGQVRVG